MNINQIQKTVNKILRFPQGKIRHNIKFCQLVKTKSQSGANKGWILSLRNTHDIKFNFGNGSTRMDSEQPLPGDYKNGWVYVVLVVDRSANKVMFSYDVGEFETIAIPAGLQNASADGYDVLNIGQDGTGKLQYALKASIDELMIFDDVLTQDDITALSRYYGI